MIQSMRVYSFIYLLFTFICLTFSQGLLMTNSDLSLIAENLIEDGDLESAVFVYQQLLDKEISCFYFRCLVKKGVLILMVMSVCFFLSLF